VQLLRSPYEISMFAWSPRGHHFAYTTSGFPVPHELFVADRPDAKPRRIFTAGRHFDWITWSPTGRWLLLDDEHAHKWQLLDASGARTLRTLPRLGGRPIWCCPQNEFSTR
jgi:Tol biopolymer transport system component